MSETLFIFCLICNLYFVSSFFPLLYPCSCVSIIGMAFMLYMAHSKNFLTLVGVQNFFPHFFHIFALTGPRNDGNMLWIC